MGALHCRLYKATESDQKHQKLLTTVQSGQTAKQSLKTRRRGALGRSGAPTTNCVMWYTTPFCCRVPRLID